MSQAAGTKISLRTHEELALFRLRRAGRRDPASIVAVDELPIGPLDSTTLRSTAAFGPRSGSHLDLAISENT
jgi:hypothetical protein